MSRFLTLYVLLASSVFADFTTPTIVAYIDGNLLPSSDFVIRKTDPVLPRYDITGAANSTVNPAYSFTFHGTTQADPAIDFDLSIAGDPTVSINIYQNLVGGPYSNLSSSGTATLQDPDNNGVSLTGSPFLRSSYWSGSGSPLTEQLNINCTSVGPCAPTSGGPFGGDFATNVLETDIAFTLSNGDSAIVTGSSTLSATPEPAYTAVLLAGMLIGLAILRRKRA